MKKLFTILMVLAMPLFMMAQENTKQKEVGLTFSSLDNFGFTYKIGTEKSMWRFNSIYTSGYVTENNDNINPESNKNFTIGFAIGKEYRKEIADKLEFRCGADISLASNFRTDVLDNSSSKRAVISPGVRAVLGLNYMINDHLVFGLELLPGVSYDFIKNEIDNNGLITTQTDNIFRYNFSTTSAQLSLAYRIK